MKKVLVYIVFGLLIVSCKQQRDSRPNVVIFFTDDQGFADLGCYGAKGFETPNLDKLASEGIRFTDFYVPATVCTPSRAGLLTGRYPVRSDLHEAVIFPFNEHGLSPDEITIAEMLKTVGYSTGIIGKWHLGHSDQKYLPNNQGFDYYYGVPYSNDMDSYYYKHLDFQSPPLPVYRNTELIDEGPDQKYLTKSYTREAIDFIDREKNNPFFLYIPHSMPHRPLHVSEDFGGISEYGLYGDVISELDWSAGEIIMKLKDEGIYENTIFVFTSDNGPDIGSALPLRGKKATTWEGGQRVPAIITWPKVIKPGVVSSEFVTTLDLFPTIARICGADLPPDVEYDGINLESFLADPQAVTLPERPFFYFGRDGDIEAVRLGKWKLHILKTRGWGSEEFPVSLFNLKDDISEQHNVAEAYPEIVEVLSIMITGFNESINTRLD